MCSDAVVGGIIAAVTPSSARVMSALNKRRMSILGEYRKVGYSSSIAAIAECQLPAVMSPVKEAIIVVATAVAATIVTIVIVIVVVAAIAIVAGVVVANVVVVANAVTSR